MVFEELILLILQFIFELLLEALVWLPWDVFLWGSERKRRLDEREGNIWLIPLGGILLGGIFGGLSLLVAPDALLKHETARVLSLVATPLSIAFFARMLAKRRLKRGEFSDAQLHFWFAFAFSGCLMLVRFMCAHR